MMDFIKSFLTPDFMARVFRTALQYGGGLITGYGIMDDATWAQISGPLLTVGTTYFTYLSTKRTAAKLEQAIEAPVGMAVPPGEKPV